ncbi:MAG: hypothetical protein REH83_04670 [Rickettsiella sp.]|nr:hypothetical protein [Rickettsiella sp.]
MINELEAIIKSHIKSHIRTKEIYQQGETTILFVTKERLADFDSFTFRSQAQAGFKTSKFVQIIGDSNPFSEFGHKKAIDHLTKLMHKSEKKLLFGDTSNQYGGANGVVGEWLEKNPTQAEKVIANIVYPESIIAVKEWGCSSSTYVKNYIVLCDPNLNGYCKFGDDIILSDNLADELVCYEGGVISFE